MGRIETSDTLMEYLDEYDILFPLTNTEAVKVLEYVINSGYTLETDGHGQLYKVDIETGECMETDIDHVVDVACEQNYEKISDIKDYFKYCNRSERENLYKSLKWLQSDEKILNVAFGRTYFQKELQAKIQEFQPPVNIAAGRRETR